MKKILLILLLLPCFASAQIETYLVSPYGNIEFDSARVMTIDSGIVYVTPTMLSDSLAGVGGVDSSIFATQYRLDSTRNGLDTRINLRVKYTDTSTMLTPYLRKVDTVSLSNRITSTDTNALKTNTPMSTTLDTVQRNGVNSALHLATVGAKLLSNGIGATITYSLGTGLNLVNYTPAVLGGQQVSPVLWLEGQGYKTNPTAASQSVRFGLFSSPVQSTSAPFGNLVFYSQIDGGTENINMFLRSNGILTVDSALVVTDGTIDIAGTQSINVGSYHGIHNDAGFTSTGASDWKGYWMSGTITQSGGGSGITRGIYLNPVVTTAADYRAIETTNSIGKSIVTGSAPSTFGGTITFPTPFTLGATSVTSTGTQLNYLSSATGTTGTTSTNLVFSTSPTLVTPNLGTPSTLVGTNITGTASGLTAGNVTTNANLTGVITSVGNATSIASQTGTGTKFVVDNTPTLITPVLGVASGTSLNLGGGTLNGILNALSTTDISLASTAHPLTVGGASTSTNLVLGEYNSALGIQARNNGASANLFLQGDGGGVSVGNGSLTGQRIFAVNNTGAGTGDYASIEVRNGSAGTDALRLYTTSTGFTPSGSNGQDAVAITSGTGLSGGMSIGTLANATFRVFSNNVERWVLDGSGNTIITGKFTSSGGGIGYSTGAGGTVTQSTSKSTGVTLNKLSGQITMNNASLAANGEAVFTLTNSFIEATDVVVVCLGSSVSAGRYMVGVATVSAGSCQILITNLSSVASEAPVINFAVIKAANN